MSSPFVSFLSHVRADLDIVAIALDQRFAAFATCWVDQGNRVGQFEPVGTAPEFRRQGLGQAVLSEGLRRMQQHGAPVAHGWGLLLPCSSRRTYSDVQKD
jgi:ribosomal protein S18 acetylase RimI-like enzyme